MTYLELLYREQKDMQLLYDMIKINLPLESYIHLIKHKLEQLTKELQEENKKYIDNQNK
jgi:hypothetical protein